MFRIMNEYLSKVYLMTSDDIQRRLNDLLDKLEGITRKSVNINFNRYVVDIHLEDFSVEEAGKYFRIIENELAYPYSSMSLRYNEGDRVSYRFITCMENKTGYYMDIIFS